MGKQGFKKGIDKVEGSGRAKGTKNKKTIEIEELRRRFINALSMTEKQFNNAFLKVLKDDPKDALKLVASILPKDYKLDIPQLKDITININGK